MRGYRGAFLLLLGISVGCLSPAVAGASARGTHTPDPAQEQQLQQQWQQPLGRRLLATVRAAKRTADGQKVPAARTASLTAQAAGARGAAAAAADASSASAASTATARSQSVSAVKSFRAVVSPTAVAVVPTMVREASPGAGALVPLDGSASTPIWGLDLVRYDWVIRNRFYASDERAVLGAVASANLTVGQWVVQLTVTDSSGDTGNDTSFVNVLPFEDASPPPPPPAPAPAAPVVPPPPPPPPAANASANETEAAGNGTEAAGNGTEAAGNGTEAADDGTDDGTALLPKEEPPPTGPQIWPPPVGQYLAIPFVPVYTEWCESKTKGRPKGAMPPTVTECFKWWCDYVGNNQQSNECVTYQQWCDDNNGERADTPPCAPPCELAANEKDARCKIPDNYKGR